MPFSHKSRHRMNCKHKCKNCLQMGPKFPCKNDEKFKQFCAGCNKTFHNKNCFLYHVKNDICFKSKKCHKCEIVYRLEVNVIFLNIN